MKENFEAQHIRIESRGLAPRSVPAGSVSCSVSGTQALLLFQQPRDHVTHSCCSYPVLHLTNHEFLHCHHFHLVSFS